jgi:3-oxoacyl-[acyl-carrier-protein] synthase-3
MIGAENAAAMDLVAACSGFVYGLDTARAMIRGGDMRHVLVIGSEVYSRILNWKDRSTCVLFGDGAGAAVVSASERTASPQSDPGSRESRIVAGYLRSRGSGANTLLRPAGGSRSPYVDGETPPEQRLLHMSGRQVYNFAVGAVAEAIQAVLDRNGLSFDDLDHVVPHQANVRIIKAAAKRGGFDYGKFYTNIEHYANTSAASIPIALRDMEAEGILERGQRLVTVGFGSGLAYGANLIVW